MTIPRGNMKLAWPSVYPWFTVLLIASIFRLYMLGTVPVSVNGDEIIYPVTAKSAYLTGSDLSGTWNPLSIFLFHYPEGERQAELPYGIHMLFSAPFHFSLLSIKLPFALLSIGTVAVLYTITKKLFGTRAAYITGLMAAVNPWLVVMGRTAFESTPATFFYLASLYLFLTAKSSATLLILIPLFLAFYSYIGTKIIFIPFIALSMLLARNIHAERSDRYYKIIGIACILLTVLFIGQSLTDAGNSRIHEILLPNSDVVVSQVNNIRKISMPNPLLPLVVNKFTVYVQIVTNKFFNILSPSYLFSDGDQFFLPARHSFFYPVDLLAILLGCVYMFKLKPGVFVLFCLFTILGTFPHIFHASTGDFSVHSTMMFPFIIIISGVGISSVLDAFKTTYGKIVRISVAGIYLLSVLNFCFVYFYQYPLQGAGDFHMRVLSRYISLHDGKTPIRVLTNTSSDVLKRHMFYADLYSADTIKRLQKRDNYLNNVTFASCDNSVGMKDLRTVYIIDSTCGNLEIPKPHIQIARLTDAGDIYRIYSDGLCSRYTLKRYPENMSLHDFDLEHMNTEQFCRTFITR